MDVRAVVGLGNPGPEYLGTRHNVGFQVVDRLAQRWRCAEWRSRHRSLVTARSGSRPLLLVKPQTFMNLSGEAFRRVCEAEELLPNQCLVVVDDVDLPLGELRLRARGSAGSHNGLKSIVEAVGEDFPRLRLGIRGEAPWRDLAEYVLAPFGSGEVAAVDEMVQRATECVEVTMRVGIARAASQFNGAPSADGDAAP